jgi:hypothetical protein
MTPPHRSPIAISLYYYGYRFYDPISQRWLNRDPIGEIGDQNIYRSFHNNSLQFYDASGLKCDDPCGDYAKAHPSDAKGGGVICCGGQKYTCAWSTGIQDPNANKIVTACMIEHEKTHLNDIKCGSSCTPKRPRFKKGSDPDREECSGYFAELICLNDRLSQCGADVNCQNGVNARIAFVGQMLAKKCGYKK